MEIAALIAIAKLRTLFSSCRGGEMARPIHHSPKHRDGNVPGKNSNNTRTRKSFTNRDSVLIKRDRMMSAIEVKQNKIIAEEIGRRFAIFSFALAALRLFSIEIVYYMWVKEVGLIAVWLLPSQALFDCVMTNRA